ncbi:hypothetical protein [Mycoplasma putrefaciens]|uniref:Transmembrane protein n=2 Tax=Mycoplasma putrefaciens TaxID=2123 RepID=M9WGS5_9MOLU|nr:hypothetical protein [Mycoplasma putrefaciens]AEM68755.1 uncharacterized protein MPUT_0379 [Mycoplasma putrefaciens KS1]AGJ90655.1 Hypothetical protein, predicted transmembrane protein [Mycoplasma putrefaciens Mput9231]
MTHNWLNLLLLVINVFLLGSILILYLFCTKSYLNHTVPYINSSNNNITSTEINNLIKNFQIMFNLKEYQVIYTDTEKMIKIFKNVHKNKKQIFISKRIFESTGYELDYLISRLWISAKQIQKDNKLTTYKTLIYTIPYTLFFLITVSFIFSVFLYIYHRSNTNFMIDNTSNDRISQFEFVLLWLWINPISSYLCFAFLMCLFVTYYLSIRYKQKLEIYYNDEVTKLVKTTISEYEFDFKAARTYAQSIKLSYIPVMKVFNFWTNHYKWTGPFTIV